MKSETTLRSATLAALVAAAIPYGCVTTGVEDGTPGDETGGRTPDQHQDGANPGTGGIHGASRVHWDGERWPQGDGASWPQGDGASWQQGDGASWSSGGQGGGPGSHLGAPLPALEAACAAQPSSRLTWSRGRPDEWWEALLAGQWLTCPATVHNGSPLPPDSVGVSIVGNRITALVLDTEGNVQLGSRIDYEGYFRVDGGTLLLLADGAWERPYFAFLVGVNPVQVRVRDTGWLVRP